MTLRRNSHGKTSHISAIALGAPFWAPFLLGAPLLNIQTWKEKHR
jgi:hypothetical protein